MSEYFGNQEFFRSPTLNSSIVPVENEEKNKVSWKDFRTFRHLTLASSRVLLDFLLPSMGEGEGVYSAGLSLYPSFLSLSLTLIDGIFDRYLGSVLQFFQILLAKVAASLSSLDFASGDVFSLSAVQHFFLRYLIGF